MSEALAAYDQLRQRPQSDDPAFLHERDGEVYRVTGPGPEPEANAVLFSRLDPAGADLAIARQVAHYARLGHAFEWKLHDHDGPPDLATRLAAAGFVAGPFETLVVFDLARLTETRAAPDAVELRELTRPDELALLRAVHPGEHGEWLVRSLASEKQAAPDALRVFAALADGEPVSAGWVRLPRGSSFATLWGGATRIEWRGRGIYSALVHARLEVARDAGRRWATVDAGPNSLPILERRGFRRLARITPWVRGA